MSLITAFLYAVIGAVTVNRNRNRTQAWFEDRGSQTHGFMFGGMGHQKFTPPTPGFMGVFLILVVGIFGFLPSVLVFIGSLFFHVTIWVSQ